jgi:hypothetical protein
MSSRDAFSAKLGATALHDLPRKLCEVGLEQLGVDGLGIALIASAEARRPLASSGDLVDDLEALQFDLGQGPCLEAHASGAPVLEPDMAAAGRKRWPVFADGAVALGAGAVFAFPLQTGVSRFGSLDAARRLPGPLDAAQLEDALQLAELASLVVLLLQDNAAAGSDGEIIPLGANRAVVHQATGMIAAQAGISLADALAWLRAQAFVVERAVHDLATDVVERRTGFTETRPDNGSTERRPGHDPS